MEEGLSYTTDDGFIIGEPEILTLHIDIDGLCKYKAIKATYGGVEHTYDPAKLKDALIWILAPYEIHENPSYECMRVAREESRAELLEMRRWDVAQMLREVEFGEGSHENLSAIANVIYEPCFGWTKDACEYLRDQLVYLIGGERDAQHGCSGGAGDCVRHDVQEEVGDGISGGDCGVREVHHDRDLRDMGDCHVSKEALMTYDVLGNERHKAICELEERKPILGMTKTEILGDLGKAVTNDPNFDPSDIDHLNLMWSTLIHLLGGERDTQRGCAGGTDTCDCRHESEEVGGQSRTCPESGPYVSESDYGMSVTSELREWASTEVPYKYGHQLHAIADRIDEQFARICKQQEQVLQDTISEMLDEIDRQKDLRDENAKVAEDAIHSSCMYLDLLRDAARDYKRLHDDYVELSHDHRELYGFAKAIEREVGENEFVTLFGVDYVPYFHIEHLSNTLSKVTGKWAKADAECRMYREMLNDAAKEYKALLEKISIAFNMWVSATGGGE